MGMMGCAETSVRNCHHKLLDSSGERRSHLFRVGSLKSGMLLLRFTLKNIYLFIYLLQLGCHPVAVVILHVNKT